MKYKNKKWLENQFITLDKSIRQISKEYDYSRYYVGIYVKKFELKKSEPLYQNKDWLYEQYITLKKSAINIAKICKCTTTPIYKWLHKFIIPVRTHIEAGERCKELYWRGENVCIEQKHFWIRKNNKKPMKCEECKKEKNLELSFNHFLGDYTRNKEDYKWLCHSCHMKRDWHKFKIMNNQFTILNDKI